MSRIPMKIFSEQAHVHDCRCVVCGETCDVGVGVEFALDANNKLNADLRALAKTMARDDCRALVWLYYKFQEDRKRGGNQISQAKAAKRPTQILEHFLLSIQQQERKIQVLAQLFASASSLGRWALSVFGVGPILAAGFLTELDEAPPQYVGHWWSFAGLSPNIVWEKGQKRPYNAGLKTLLWKFAQVQKFLMNSEKSFYGPYYKQRKAFEIQQTVTGQHILQAQKSLSDFEFGEDTMAIRWYEGRYSGKTGLVYHQLTRMPKELLLLKVQEDIQVQEYCTVEAKKLTGSLSSQELLSTFLHAHELEEGMGVPMLPPQRLDLRAMRWIEKLFLSHYHHVAYTLAYGTPPPAPYVFEHVDGHKDFIAPPGLPVEELGKESSTAR